jgi:hypothetical protein
MNIGSLSRALVAQHELSNEIACLEEAVQLARECYRLCPEGHRGHGYGLFVLINALKHLVVEGVNSAVSEELERLQAEHDSL